MNQTGNSVSKINKRTIRLQALNRSLCHETNLNIGNLVSALLLCFLTEKFLCRKYQSLFLFIYINYLNLKRLVQVLFCILYIIQRKFGCRDKTSNTFHISNGSAVYDSLYNNIQCFPGFLKLLQFIPCKYICCLCSGKKNISLSVIFPKNGCLDLFSRLNCLFNIKSRLSGKFLCRNKSLSIIFKIKNNSCLIHTDHCPGDDITFLNFLKRSLQLLLKIFHRLRHFLTSVHASSFHHLLPAFFLFFLPDFHFNLNYYSMGKPPTLLFF